MKVKNKNSLYFNFYSGVSGDMLIGSLIDLGVEVSALKEILGKIDDRLSLKVKNVKRGVNNCTLIKPEFPKELNKIFNWNELRNFGNFFKDEKFVYQNFNETIELLKKSEENVHNEVNTRPHELGNFDTVFDIVCFYKSLEYLGIENLYHSGIPFSQGEIEIDHGAVSSLAPVTLDLIKNLHIPIYTTKKNPNFEMCTPTGISLLKNFNQNDVAEGVISRIGYGAGTGLMIGGWSAFIAQETTTRNQWKTIGTSTVLGGVIGLLLGTRSIWDPAAPRPDMGSAEADSQILVKHETSGFKIAYSWNF